RNPRTGDSVAVPAKQVPYFKASNELKGRLNPGMEVDPED
ncbi:HU family DNA-binding protein, partial [bacterium]|nr:HU family DNA-binding protein [bacterium]